MAKESAWTKVFSSCNFPKSGKVVEIASGKNNKITKALSLYGFSGKLFLIEPDIKALNSLVKDCKKILPNSEIIPVPFPLNKVNLPKVDAIVSNHPLDDMLIGKFIKDFDAYYNASPNEIKLTWRRIESNKLKLEKAKEIVFNEWIKLIEKTQPSKVIISQYESSFFKKHKIKSPDIHGYDILKRIKEKYNSKEIKKRWLLISNPK